MRDAWTLAPGDRRYVVQNGSAIFAFVVGNGSANDGFDIIAAHSDSPGFRIKPHCEIQCEGMVKLNTEVYGGPILYTWFDRPLSIAGRVALRGEDPFAPRDETRPFRRAIAGDSSSCNPLQPPGQRRQPVVETARYATGPCTRLQRAQGLDTQACCRKDKCFARRHPRLRPVVVHMPKAGTVGLEGEMVCSGRIDDLSMVHAGMTAMLEACDTPSMHTRVLAIFDNEETGSGTKQGAGSPILEHILRRIVMTRGGAESDFMRAVASSFMVSADNAHGLHPNYVSKYDPTNHPLLGGGPCIKVNANCKYMTDADSSSAFIAVCERAGVPCQSFVNHSDVAGGSTLGNILTSQIPLRGVDMGAPVWAMHSASETASAADHIYTIRAFTEFYSLYPAK